MIDDIDQSWELFKTSILAILDKHSPIKKIYTRDFELPWCDDELLIVRSNRNIAYKDFRDNVKQNNADPDALKNHFKYWKSTYDSLYEQKIMEYFDKRGINDFKNNKLFWDFYSAFIKIKSDKTKDKSIPSSISYDNINYSGYAQVSEAFNLFFYKYPIRFK